MIISANNCWKDAIEKHKSYFDQKTKIGITQYSEYLNGRLQIFITENLHTIRDGEPRDLLELANEFTTIINSLDPTYEKEENLYLISKIFNYGNFITKRKKQWCAYHLCSSCAVLTCAYCNLTFAHTILKDKTGKIRPTLDHYFDKDRFPFLSISINNLIPSCHTCNSSLKGSSNFLKKQHLHPLTDTESIVFNLDVKLSARWDITEIQTAKLKLTPINQPARNSMSTFLLQERYEMIEGEARSIVEGLIAQSSAPQILRDIKILDWVLRGVNAKNYKNRVMGKMILDLEKQFLG